MTYRIMTLIIITIIKMTLSIKMFNSTVKNVFLSVKVQFC